jgi:predicted DNA-binding protein
MYSGESGHFNARLPIELINRLEAKANDLQTTKSMLARTILEMILLTPEAIKERVRKENALRLWFKAGMPEDTNPEKEWNKDA